MCSVWVAIERDGNSSGGGEPGERLDLGVEVEVVAPAVVRVDCELAGVDVRGEQPVGGVGLGEQGDDIATSEGGIHEPFGTQLQKSVIIGSDDLVGSCSSVFQRYVAGSKFSK